MNALQEFLSTIAGGAAAQPEHALTEAQSRRALALRNVWANNVDIAEGLVAAEYVVAGPVAAVSIWKLLGQMSEDEPTDTTAPPEPEPTPQPTPAPEPTPQGDEPVTFQTGDDTPGGTVLFGPGK